MAMERMLAKLSTRRYGAGLEPVGARRRSGRRVDVEVGDLPPVRGRYRVGAGRLLTADLASSTWWRS